MKWDMLWYVACLAEFILFGYHCRKSQSSANNKYQDVMRYSKTYFIMTQCICIWENYRKSSWIINVHLGITSSNISIRKKIILLDKIHSSLSSIDQKVLLWHSSQGSNPCYLGRTPTSNRPLRLKIDATLITKEAHSCTRDTRDDQRNLDSLKNHTCNLFSGIIPKLFFAKKAGFHVM